MLSQESPEIVSWLTGVIDIVGADITIKQCSVWFRVVKTSEMESKTRPFAFIHRETGDIYRSANWRFPLKNITRGNVFDESNGLAQITATGPAKRKAGCPKGFKYDYVRKPAVRKKKDRMYGEPVPEAPLISIPKPAAPLLVKPPSTLPVKVTETDDNFWSAEEDYE